MNSNYQLPPIVVAAFYRFVELPDYEAWQPPLQDIGEGQGLRGTILLAPEGINATIAGNRQGIDTLLTYLRSQHHFADLEVRESLTTEMPFQRLKVRLRSQIITMGEVNLDPALGTGTYVEPADWNALISEPDMVVLDTRNQYEVEIGTFQGAIDPGLDSFGEFPDYAQKQLKPEQHRRIAMFCTGGIRCEKASAYLLSQGFEQVYQLKGGILNYLAQTSPEESLWQGECFVFDDRVSLDQTLKSGSYRVEKGRVLSQSDFG